MKKKINSQLLWEKYFNYSFDDLLLKNNKMNIINNKNYINFKNIYLNNTLENFNKLKELQLIIENNKNNELIFDSVKIFLNQINENIKKIEINQKILFTNFSNYCNYLIRK